MQIATTSGIGYLKHEDTDARQHASSFRALFLLSGSKGVSPGVLRNQLGLSEDDFGALLDRLQRTYLVDVVSELRGESVVEYFRLTDEEKATLQQMMERMCELPELE
jgi:DNA-binding transcriptional ArsR family regulator